MSCASIGALELWPALARHIEVIKIPFNKLEAEGTQKNPCNPGLGQGVLEWRIKKRPIPQLLDPTS